MKLSIKLPKKYFDCTTHKTETMSYLEWHAWAEERVKKGDKQKQCPKCKRWFFEDYF